MEDWPLNLADVKNLRSLILQVDFQEVEHEPLSQTLFTVTSPFFSEFILDVGLIVEDPDQVYEDWERWGTWAEIDEMFVRMDVERGFRMVIRAEKFDTDLHFIAQARIRLPLMDARGRLVFEIEPALCKSCASNSILPTSQEILNAAQD